MAIFRPGTVGAVPRTRGRRELDLEGCSSLVRAALLGL